MPILLVARDSSTGPGTENMLQHRQSTPHPNRVGLDIGSHTIKAVEVMEPGAEIIIRAAGAAVIPNAKGKQSSTDQGAIVQAIRSLWSSARLHSTEVVLSLPADSVYIKWLHLEAANIDDLTQTARAAAVRGAPFPEHDAIVDFRVLPAYGNIRRNVHLVMLVAASGTAVDKLLNTVEMAGLEPLAVDIGAAAVLRCSEIQKKTGNLLWNGQPLAHCIIGAKSTTIIVIRGGELEFARTVPVGGNDFTDCITHHTGCTWAEAEQIKMTHGTKLIEGSVLVSSQEGKELRIPCDNAAGRLARETQRSLRFFRSQYAEGSYLGMIGTTTLSGGGALLKGIDTIFQEQGVEVKNVVNPFSGFSVAAEGGIQSIGSSSPAYTTAMGLAQGNYWSEAEQEIEAAA